MNIRTFTGKKLIDVITRIHHEIGPQALVIDTKTDKRGVTVTVAVREPKEGTVPVTIKENKTNLELPLKNKINQCLANHGFSEKTRFEFLSDFTMGPDDSVVDVLADMLSAGFSFHKAEVGRKLGERLMLIGAPGVGKTIMAAKLLAAAVFEGRKVHIVTIDSLKAGAVFQLQSYAYAMGMEVVVCRHPSELKAFLATCARDEDVIIDTPGIDPRERQDAMRLAEFIYQFKAAPIWVAGATINLDVAKQQALAFAGFGADKVIISQGDLVDRFGSIMEAIRVAKYVMLGLNHSPYIGRPFITLRPSLLAKILLAKAGLMDINIPDHGWEKILKAS
ncbi:MAG: hypothetical protein BGO28_04555 [Alphaproteobacteria bacterium 43-37]|nr:MAG: hypothetical protein BGO28_04555 [Alphaproteobacteria bacterium 43-37]